MNHRSVAFAKLAKAAQLSAEAAKLYAEAAAELEAEPEETKREITDRDCAVARAKLAEIEERRVVRTRVVYFVQGVNGGPIKIGTAIDVAHRLSGLQNGSHVRLKVLATMDGGFSEERALHRRFAAHHVTGEWFEPAAPVLAFIDALAKGVTP